MEYLRLWGINCLVPFLQIIFLFCRKLRQDIADIRGFMMDYDNKMLFL